MKYFLMIAVLAVLTLACGSSSSSKTVAVQEPKSVGTSSATAAAQATVPAEKQTPAFEVVTYTVRQSLVGFLYVDGFLLNTSNTDAESIKLVVSLLDAEGNLAGTSSYNNAELSVAKAGQTYPFSMLIDDAPEKWSSVTFQVQSRTYDPKGIFPAYLDFKTDKVTTKASNSSFKVLGFVVNTGNKVGQAKIVVVLYDEKGAVIAVEDGYSKVEGIGPGANSPFEVEFYTEQTPAKYDVFVQGSGFFTDPE